MTAAGYSPECSHCAFISPNVFAEALNRVEAGPTPDGKIMEEGPHAQAHNSMATIYKGMAAARHGGVFN